MSNKVIYKYTYSQIVPVEEGLAFIITEPTQNVQVADGMLAINDFTNPMLKQGAYVKMLQFSGYNGRESWHHKFFPFVNFKMKEISQIDGGAWAVLVDFPSKPVAAPVVPATVDTTNPDQQYYEDINQGAPDTPTYSGNYVADAAGEISISDAPFAVAENEVTGKLISVPDGWNKWTGPAMQVKDTIRKALNPAGKKGWDKIKWYLLVIIILVVLYYAWANFVYPAIKTLPKALS